MRRQSKSDEVKSYCVQLLETLGSRQYSKDAITTITTELYNEIKVLGSNALLELFLTRF